MSKFLRGVRSGVTVTYGASADAGEVDDPTVVGVTYSTSVSYSRGALVTPDSGTTWYYSRSDSNLGNAVSNNTYWLQISKFYYYDVVNGSDANTGSTDPATAKAAPLKTIQRLADYVDTGGSVNGATKEIHLLKRNDIQYGSVTINLNEIIIGAWGTGTRPEIRFENNTGRYFTGNVIDFFSGGTGSIVRNLRINARYITHYGFTAGTGTMADGDVIWRQSNHAITGTVRGNPANGRISIQYDTNTDSNGSYSGVIFETQDGSKTFTINTSKTLVNGVGASSVANCQLINCEVFNAVGNGIGSGTTGTRNSASGYYIYNCIIHDTCKFGGNGAGMQGGWGTGIKILHCTSYDNGVNNNGSHNFYLDDLDSVEFAYNWTYMTGAWGNHGLVVHGQCTGGDIHDNLIESSQSGIGLNDGYPDIAHGGWYEEIANFNVYRNIIRNLGQYNGSGLIFDIAACTNCNIYNNLAYNNKGVIGSAPYKTATDKAITANLVWAYNTFVSDTTVGSGDYFFKVNSVSGVPVTSITIQNNIIESQRTGLATFYTDASVPYANASLLNNLIYNTTGYTSVIRWQNVAYTLSSWAGTAGINSNSTNVTTSSYSSVYVNEGTDFKLQSSSPAKLIGSPLPAVTTSDLLRLTRSGSAPSGGAYE